ncbi:MAG: hypothetical protein CL927_06770, partial [Deltaproteobacteria bacterium]|nr:hypothetical protein [Deltaproteobacteria bacterium]
AGRRAARAFAPERDDEHRARIDARVWEGICEGRGAHLASALTSEGRHGPRPVVPIDLLRADAGACIDGEAYARGLAFAWARYVGCDEPADRLLAEQPGMLVDWFNHDTVLTERRLGCRLVRGRLDVD